MSINLQCNKLELWQTPTYITFMCLETATPVAALKAYCHWVSDQHVKVRKNSEDEELFQSQWESIQQHLKDVKNVMNDSDIDVYYI